MKAANQIPNGDFKLGELGGLPEGWSMNCPQPYICPNFALVEEDGVHLLKISGNGNEKSMGWLTTSFPTEGGQAYRMSVRFKASEDVNPFKNLMLTFWVDCDINNGIFHFSQIDDEEFVGEGLFYVPGEGEITGEVRVCYRFHSGGQVMIREIGLERTAPIPERNVRVACVQGHSDNLELWGSVIDRAAAYGADLILLPETFTGYDPRQFEPIDGPCASLMSRKAKQHRMYVSGTFIHRDAEDGHLYNSGLLFDRGGKRAGRYDKLHLYSPELMHDGITPGRDVPVFSTDFGTIGMMICYDSWFPDVAELLALKGAELILFPNAGYYRTLMPARANDNGVRIVSSSMYYPCGVWDTSGGDVEFPDLDPTRCSNNDRTFKDVVRDNMETIELLMVTLDLNQSPSAANWGGPTMSAPGSRRNRREQLQLLYQDIQNEIYRV